MPSAKKAPLEKTEPKFNVWDFVIGSKPGCEGLVQIDMRDWSETRGWIYGIHYRQQSCEGSGIEFCMRGGSSAWWDEAYFTHLVDPVDRLRAEYTRRAQQTEELKRQLKVLGEEMRHLEFSLAKLMPQPKEESADA